MITLRMNSSLGDYKISLNLPDNVSKQPLFVTLGKKTV